LNLGFVWISDQTTDWQEDAPMAKAKDTGCKKVEKDAQEQYVRSDHGRKNDGVTSVKPRVLPDQPTQNSEAEGTEGWRKRD
jgi:hypothetical protein